MPAEVPTLPNERTALGWQRSALSLVVIAVVVVVHGVSSGDPAVVAAGALPVAAAAWTQLRGRRLYARRAARGPALAPDAVRTLALVTAGVALLAAGIVAGGA
jgi:uncharacterized membrane protein YidH (DUF202 family)